MTVNATIDGIGLVSAIEIINPGSGYAIGDVVYLDNPATPPLTWAGFTIAGVPNITQQSYPGTLMDTVTTIGTGQELGLWDPAAASPYDTAPVFYGYQNNPYIAKLEVSDWNNLSKNSRGVSGPSPTAGKVKYEIVSMYNGGADYVAGSKNINTNISPTPDLVTPSWSEKGNKGSGVILDILNVDDGTGATQPVGTVGATGSLWNRGSVAIVNDKFKGIKGFVDPGDTPYVCRLDVLAGNSVGQMQMQVSKSLWPGYMSPILTVYETEPIESKLDIYWETSTSGLVSNLNTKIGTSDSWTPYGFCTISAQPISYNHNESFALATDVFNSIPIYIQNYNGTIISSVDNSFSLASVIDDLSAINSVIISLKLSGSINDVTIFTIL
jgi:hypothetical protein